MRYIIILSLPFLLSSCNLSEYISPSMTFTFFAVLFVLLIVMFIYTLRSKNRLDKAVMVYSVELQQLIDGIEDKEKKVKTLEANIANIYKNERYKKDEVNRNKLLVIAYEKLAIIHYKADEHTKVLDICSKIIDLDPRNMMAFYNRGTLYGNLGMYSKAEKDLTEAIDIDSSYANVYNNRGMIYEKIDELEKAITDYGYALELEDSPISYYNRGNVYYKLKDNEKALGDYKAALKLDLEGKLKTNIEQAMKRIEG